MSLLTKTAKVDKLPLHQNSREKRYLEHQILQLAQDHEELHPKKR